MRKFLTVVSLIFVTNANAQGLKLALGNFDFSDDGMRSSMVELNYDFGRSNDYGVLKPTTGAFITRDSASYAYIGGKIDFKLGPFILSPSFGPGYYDQGNGKDLGHELEFKSQIDLGLNIGKSSNLSFGYSHLSNASLGDKNPGANSYSFSLSHIF